MCHDCLYRVLRIGQREQFISHKSAVSALFQMAEDFFIIDLSCARFVASRCVCHMDMAELAAVVADRIADTSFIDLHMVYIIQ